MVGNSNFVKTDKSRKSERQETQTDKQKKFKGKTWKRVDKRAQVETGDDQ